MTVWDAFFMILTVIPAAKFLREIFMKLVARAGGINEEAMAGKGMLLLGLGAALATGRRKMIPGLGSGLPLLAGNGGGGVPYDSPGMGGAMGVGSGLNASMPSQTLNLPSITQSRGAAAGYTMARPPVSVQTGGEPAAGIAGGSGPAGSPLPSGYRQSSSGLILPSGAGDTGGDSYAPAASAPKQSAMQEMLSRQGLHKAGNVGKLLGVASAVGAPAVAPITAGVMGAAAKPVYAVTKMAGSLTAETYRQYKDGKGLSSPVEAVRAYTGQQSAMRGAASMAGAATASAFGSKAANYVAGAFNPSVDNRIDWKSGLFKRDN
jgi:hypothetical protein